MNPMAVLTHKIVRRFLLGLCYSSFLLVAAVPVGAQWVTWTPIDTQVGTYPYSVITADFNGDGKLDLAVANPGSDPASEANTQGSVSILLGNGDGSFAPKVDYPAGTKSAGLISGDFNGDGKLDLAVTNFGSSSISVLLGKGDGTFNPKNDITVAQTPAFIATGDFNRDGKLDLVFTNFLDSAFTIMLSKGDGSFLTGTEFPGGVKPVGIAVADFNRDGFLDVATTSTGDDTLTPAIKPEVHLEYGKGDGSLDTQNQKGFAIGLDPLWLSAVDFNGDGSPDLAVATEDFVSILLNIDGLFSPKTDFGLNAHGDLAGLAAGDLNGDGNIDLVATNGSSPAISFLPGNGRGGFAPRRGGVALAGTPTGAAVGDFNGDGRLDVAVAIATSNVVSVFINNSTTSNAVVPIVLSLAGASNSFYTSEMTLTNRGNTTSTVDFTYTPAFGGGAGSGFVTLEAGKQMIVPDAIDFLKQRGVPIPDSGNRGGTLRVQFTGLSSPSDGIVTVRTTTVTRDSEGRAGLAYSDVHTDVTALWETSYLCGLRESEKDRSNVAIINAGSPNEGSITLRLTLYSGDPANPITPYVLPDVILAPGEFKQCNQILTSNGVTVRQGFVKIQRTSGIAPYFAYGVINDQSNSDGSFILPIPASAQKTIHRLTIPVMVETSKFSSELVISNLVNLDRTVRLDYVADAITAANNTASLEISLKPGEQMIISEFAQYLRDKNIVGVGPAGSTFAGAVFVTVEPDAAGDATGLYVNGRTSTPGGGGRFGLFYSAVPQGQTAQQTAWLFGLQQNSENRTNLALVNTGEKDNSTDVFTIELYDGTRGSLVKTLENVSLGPRKWIQLNTILTQASGTTQGYARITRVAGSNPFIAYAVINDGGAPGERSGDGAFIQMERDD
jgi:hypothetical protein